jgi:excisionase family DNA binding protein
MTAHKPRLISIRAAAEILALSPKTLYSWFYSRSNHLDFVKLGRSVRVVEDSVYALIQRNRRQS